MKIVILEPLGIPAEKTERLMAEAVGTSNQLVCYNTREEDIKTLTERSRDADAVVLTNIRYPRAVMEQCPNLKYICVAFTGYDHVDMDYCREKGILVSNCSGYSTSAVSDLVFAFILCLERKIISCNETVREGKTRNGFTGFELEGKKFGIIGAGTIGLRVAAIAAAFGCDVYAYSRTRKEIPGITFTELDELLKTCDIISVHVPQNSSTIGMINAEKIAEMKPGAIFINTARGPIVDSQALAGALNSGRIAGAGIDVFETEPPVSPDHPLLCARNCICTPHIGFATEQAMEKRAVLVSDNLKGWLSGNPVHLVS